nr:phospholipase [Saccharopolyspora sp. HNM0983]
MEWGADPADAERAVLAVHGRGQGPDFLQRTALRFGDLPVRFHAPRAAGGSWYPGSFRDPPADNQPALEDSLDVLAGCTRLLADRGFPPERTVLWGFSQGACLLAHYALTRARARFGGIILFTGGYLGPDGDGAPPPEPALRGVDALLRTVDRDPWVPPQRVADTAEVLRRSGAHVDLRIDPGAEHIITDEACTAAARLLARPR